MIVTTLQQIENIKILFTKFETNMLTTLFRIVHPRIFIYLTNNTRVNLRSRTISCPSFLEQMNQQLKEVDITTLLLHTL